MYLKRNKSNRNIAFIVSCSTTKKSKSVFKLPFSRLVEARKTTKKFKKAKL